MKILLISLLVLFAIASRASATVLNSITVCQNGLCPLSAGANTTANCNTTTFTDGQCLSFANNLLSVSCGAMGTCVYGSFYPAATDCSGAGYNFSSFTSPDTIKANRDPACMTIDSASGTGATWTFIVPDLVNNQYQLGLACGLQCTGCLALSPAQSFGTCYAFNTGSIRLNGAQACRQAMVNAYSSTCADDVPASQLPIGSGFPGACRATNAITGSLAGIEVTCNEPLPTTSTAAPPTTATPPPPTTSAPGVTHVACTGFPSCKGSCRPTTYNSGTCVNGNPALNQSGSWFTVCSQKYIATKYYNMTSCMGVGQTVYVSPDTCYPDGQGGGWYTHCANN